MRKELLEQWRIVTEDKWLLSCLTWIPIVLAVGIWVIFSQGIARDLPIAVIDLEHSQLSRQLTQRFDASPTLEITQEYSDISAAKHAMIQQDIYGYIVIPKHFDRDIFQNLNPQVSVFYNSQFILVGKLLNSAILQVQGTLNAEIEVMKGLSHGDVDTQTALGQAVTVQTQITPLFNKNTSYAQFLISAIVPALWQITIVVSTILILAANIRERGLKEWLSSAPLTALGKTLLPYLGLFLILGTAFTCWFYSILQWPFNGNLLVLALAQLLTAVACMIVGSTFFFLTLDPARAMSFAGAFTAPSFAFMGITFPVSEMNTMAQAWRSLLPISHYIEIQTAQSSYGVTNWQSIVEMLPYVGYALPAIITAVLVKKHLSTVLPLTGKS